MADLFEQCDIPKATLTRLLKKLSEVDYISKVEHGRYVAGPKLYSLAATAINQSLTGRFMPLLQEMVARTGLNAELYNLTEQGPQLLRWEGGRSHFQVRMSPGHQVGMDAHPAVYFYWLLYDIEDTLCWGKDARGETVSAEEFAQFKEQAGSENFIFEQGHMLPEISRACVRVFDSNYVIGLSGLSSEFTMNVAELKRMMLIQAEFFAELL